MAWVRQIRYPQPAQESTRRDYLHEVEHRSERVLRLRQASADAVKLALPEMQEVVQGLQALRGIAQITAVTIVAELGRISRFQSARRLMGYSGAVPSEDSSGKRSQRGSITKAGNAHLRRIAVEAAWSYRRRHGMGSASWMSCRICARISLLQSPSSSIRLVMFAELVMFDRAASAFLRSVGFMFSPILGFASRPYAGRGEPGSQRLAVKRLNYVKPDLASFFFAPYHTGPAGNSALL
jgi:hypothetical protein